MSAQKHRMLFLLGGDLCMLWIGLLVMLFVRLNTFHFLGDLILHALPFSIIFGIWLLIFYIAGLYEIRNTNQIPTTLALLIYATAASFTVAIGLFYFVPYFIIAPKINLILDYGITTLLLIGWRIFFVRSMNNSAKLRVLLVGTSPDLEELMAAIKRYPQLGYSVLERVPNAQDIALYLKTKEVDIVVATREIQQDQHFIHMLYETLQSGIRFIDAAIFYEKVLGKIPVALISKAWFLENIAETEKTAFEIAKRGFDIVFSIVIGIFTAPFLPLVAIVITLDSPGPIFLRQQRVGKFGKIYTHYKYRTMIALTPDGHAEPKGAEWAKENDTRITRVGKLLRVTRIDELPQLWNVLKGELSFVGPRPERPEFVEALRKEIPFYDMRHLVRPGLSGWAQINPPYYYGTRNEAMIKLQYDLYYIKNRDLGLDLDITLKTLMVIASAQGR